jgi:hypothetical protein
MQLYMKKGFTDLSEYHQLNSSFAQVSIYLFEQLLNMLLFVAS